MARQTDLSPPSVFPHLDERLVLFLESGSRDEALASLVDALAAHGKLRDRDEFYQAILDREKIVSTGIGMGVALPHAKLPSLSSFFIAIGVHHRGLDWDALDGAPVRLIFMIGGPDNQQTEYLQLLSRLTLAIKDEEIRKKLLQSTSPKEMMTLFKGV